MNCRLKGLSLLAGLCLMSMVDSLFARESVFLEPSAFVEQGFSENPEGKVLWLTREVKDTMEQILGHREKAMRIRYWQLGQRTAWVLEEIGKVELITAGFIIEDNQMVEMQVLVYRESHGWEVKYPFFTTQFEGLMLDRKKQLNRRIDGISGATLSVNALKRLSRVALFLHGEVIE